MSQLKCPYTVKMLLDILREEECTFELLYVTNESYIVSVWLPGEFNAGISKNSPDLQEALMEAVGEVLSKKVHSV